MENSAKDFNTFSLMACNNDTLDQIKHVASRKFKLHVQNKESVSKNIFLYR